ncbi:uncharacterized protein Tco025E_10300, partial [Trypanosoma conorhini]
MGGDRFRRRLVRFYEVHNPSCLSSVDAIWQTYRDREEDLFKVLTDKYGPEPVPQEGAGESSRQRGCGPNWHQGQLSLSLEKLQLSKQPQETTEDTEDAKNLAGPKVNLSSAPKRVGTNAESGVHYPRQANLKTERNDNLREKLIEFYRVHNNSMIPFVDEVIESYRDNEERMFEDLHCQYRTARELVLPVTASSFDDVNAVIKRLSDALEIKTAETLALKKDKEYLTEELTVFNKLQEEIHEREKQLKTQLLAAREQLQECNGGPELELKTAEVIALKKENERLAKELDVSNKLLENVQENEKMLKSQLL